MNFDEAPAVFPKRKEVVPLLTGVFIALAGQWAWENWQAGGRLSEAMQAKQNWLFPYFGSLFPFMLLALGLPLVFWLSRFPYKRLWLALGLTIPSGCFLAVLTSLLGRALEGRPVQFSQITSSEDVGLLFFLFIYAVDRIASWQFVALQLTATLAMRWRCASVSYNRVAGPFAR